METEPKSKRVLLVDDHPGILSQLRQLLRAEFEVVDMLSDGTGLDAALARSRPDLVVLDISLPGVNGIELARRLTTTRCPARIVFLTVHEDADFAREALAVGALGYVVKPRLGTDLLPALRAALAGRYFISPCPALKEFVSWQGTFASPAATPATPDDSSMGSALPFASPPPAKPPANISDGTGQAEKTT